MAKFTNEKRAEKTNVSLVNDVLKKSLKKKTAEGNPDETELYSVSQCTPKDAEKLAVLYKDVFLTYPFPIDNPDYIVSTMQNNISYFGVWYKGQLVAISSAEQYREHQFVEMTDFATLPAHQGKGLASVLLGRMELEMKKIGFIISYTSARAVSYGMNGVFAKTGYKFSGTLINNTFISGHIEHMNVWYKRL